MADTPVTIFHGTSQGYTQVALPDPLATGTGRHGGDQYGIGYYVASNSDPDVARRYATTYAGDNGVVLTGTLSPDTRLLNFDQPLSEADATRLRTALNNVQTGVPELDTYYRNIAANLNPGDNSGHLWNALTNTGTVAGRHSVSGDVTQRLGIHMDQIATGVINTAGFDGLLIPREDTIVFKGTGVTHVPDMRVADIVGNGPRNASEDFRARIAAGDTIIPGQQPVRLDPNQPVTVDPRVAQDAAFLSTVPGRDVVQRAMDGGVVVDEGRRPHVRIDITDLTDAQRVELNRALAANNIRTSIDVWDNDEMHPQLNGRRLLTIRAEDASGGEAIRRLEQLSGRTVAEMVTPAATAVDAAVTAVRTADTVADTARVVDTVADAVPNPRIPGIRGNVIGAAVVGGITSIVALSSGANAAEAAEAGALAAADTAIPGVSNNFQGIREGRLADRILDGLDTATGTVATGAAVASVVPGAQPVSVPVAVVAGAANLGVNLARDVTYLTGLGDRPGAISAIVAAVGDRNRNVDLFSTVDTALRNDPNNPDAARLTDLRSNRDLIAQQLRTLEDYNPNALGGQRNRGTPAPYTDQFGMTWTSYRDIRTALQGAYSEAHGTYFDAVMDTARTHPEQIAGIIAGRQPGADPAATPTGTNPVAGQFDANIRAATDPRPGDQAAVTPAVTDADPAVTDPRRTAAVVRPATAPAMAATA